MRAMSTWDAAVEPTPQPGRQTSMRSLLVIASLLVLTSACSSSATVGGIKAPDMPSGSVLTTPSPRDVVGRWRVVRVDGHAPPQGALRGLRMYRVAGHYSAIWSDGVNSHSLAWILTPSGGYRAGRPSVSTVGCISSCAKPSGFGVAQASALRLTSSGMLVFLGKNGVELARYERSP